MTNKRVNNGSLKCRPIIYSISLPFDLEDCACILFTVIDFAGKGLHVRINARYMTNTSQNMHIRR